MDCIPRTLSRGQAYDALSSQANITGYRAVVEAGNEFGREFELSFLDMKIQSFTVPRRLTLVTFYRFLCWSNDGCRYACTFILYHQMIVS